MTDPVVHNRDAEWDRDAAIARRWDAVRLSRVYREAAAHLEARAAGEDALGEYMTAVALRVGRDALMVRAAEIEAPAGPATGETT